MKKINIAELLKNCPKGMELDCTLYENVIFDSVDMDKIFPIKLDISGAHRYIQLTEEGCLTKHPYSKRIIFPKGKTTWEGFVPPCEFKKESKDERIKTAILNHLKKWWGNSQDDVCGIHIEDAIAWLEKQSEKPQGKSALEAINEEKIDNQNCVKPTDKIEPKFKVGDKIIHKDDPNVIYTITDIVDDCYYCGANLCFSFDYQDDYKLVYNKFDISTLKPYDKVLARDNDSQKWDAELFNFYDNESEDYHFRLVGTLCARYCIPFMGNEHLLGTTDDCNEFYKTWE